MQSNCVDLYDFEIRDGVIDWRPILLAILNETGTDQAKTARKFHNTLTAIIVAAVSEQEQKRILLTGGCFQNKLLLESAIKRLKQAGFEPFWHWRIPPNDGGLAAGQIMAAIREQT
jgi:hydrogenase maturation protein HypF